jgi:hypothetical protein
VVGKLTTPLFIMSTFHKGSWTKTPPTKPGIYFVADSWGRLYPLNPIVVSQNPDGYLYVSGKVPHHSLKEIWDAWWWSEPFELPPVPVETAGGS